MLTLNVLAGFNFVSTGKDALGRACTRDALCTAWPSPAIPSENAHVKQGCLDHLELGQMATLLGLVGLQLYCTKYHACEARIGVAKGAGS